MIALFSSGFMLNELPLKRRTKIKSVDFNFLGLEFCGNFFISSEVKLLFYLVNDSGIIVLMKVICWLPRFK